MTAKTPSTFPNRAAIDAERICIEDAQLGGGPSLLAVAARRTSCAFLVEGKARKGARDSGSCLAKNFQCGICRVCYLRQARASGQRVASIAASATWPSAFAARFHSRFVPMPVSLRFRVSTAPAPRAEFPSSPGPLLRCNAALTLGQPPVQIENLRRPTRRLESLHPAHLPRIQCHVHFRHRGQCQVHRALPKICRPI